MSTLRLARSRGRRYFTDAVVLLGALLCLAQLTTATQGIPTTSTCAPSAGGFRIEMHRTLPKSVLCLVLGWFVLVLITEHMGDEPRLRARTYAFVLSVPLLALLVRAAYAVYERPGRLSPQSEVMFAAAIVLFVTLGTAKMQPIHRLPGSLAHDLATLVHYRLGRTVVAFGVVIAMASAGWFSYRVLETRRTMAKSATAFADWFATQPRVSLASSVRETRAPIVIVKFNDYQCPPCKASFLSYRSLLAGYDREKPGMIETVTLDFPLDRDCNDAVAATIHPLACEAAVAVRLAGRGANRQAKARLERWIFDNQDRLSANDLWEAAARLSAVTYSQPGYDDALREVRMDSDLGSRMGVKSTPTFFVNGVRIEGAVPVQFLEAALAKEAQHLPAIR